MYRSTEVRVTFDYDDFIEALTATEEEHSPKREAYQTLKEHDHLLVLTTVIVRQYQGAGFRNPALVGRSIAQARQDCRVTEQRRGGRPPNIPRLPTQHRRLFQAAVQAGSNFFITQWERWLDLSKEMEERYQLLVVTPSEYIRRVSS